MGQPPVPDDFVGRPDYPVPADAPFPFFSPEHIEFVQACFSAEGLSVVVDLENKTISYDGPQTAEYAVLIEACLQQAVEIGLVGQSLHFTEEGRRELYRLWTTFTYPCLVENDFPTIPPPSEDAFVDGGGVSVWYPYKAIDAQGGGPSNDLRTGAASICTDDPAKLLLGQQ